jgi:predicted nicotinamide N-methyase
MRRVSITDAGGIDIDITPDLHIRLLQHASSAEVLEAAVRDPSVDPYAHILWPSSLAAARALPPIVRPGHVVLDVGAGTGLCALTAAALGARAVALDRDAASLARISRASRMNRVIVETVLCDVYSAASLPDCDLAVFADLLYEPALARAIGLRIVEVMSRGGSVIIADPGRASRAVLDGMLTREGIDVAYRDVVVQLPGDTPAIVQVAVLSAERCA